MILSLLTFTKINERYITFVLLSTFLVEKIHVIFDTHLKRTKHPNTKLLYI